MLRLHLIALGACLIAPCAVAQTTIEYEYDALGRLTDKVDPYNGNRAFTYDDAGNRTNLTTNGATSGGGGGGGNQAPVANSLFIIANINTVKTIQVSSVGSDPDGDAITFVSVSQGSIAGNGLSFQVSIPNTPDQTMTIDYTIEDPSSEQDSDVITIYIEDPNNPPL